MSGNGDYISREDALNHIREYIDEYGEWTDENGWHSDKWCAMKEAEGVLEKLPAADVRPVVLCRDCKWYQIDELKKDGTEDRRYKPSVCVLAEQRRDPNHFCADGKKREGSE